MYKCIFNESDVTQEFSHLISLGQETSTWNKNNLVIKNWKTNVSKKCFFFWCAKLWNHLPNTTKEWKYEFKRNFYAKLKKD